MSHDPRQAAVHVRRQMVVAAAVLAASADRLAEPLVEAAARRQGLGRALMVALLDEARRRKAAKRPQHHDRVELSEISGAFSGEVDYAALSECMEALEQIDPRQANIVSLRFFVGLTADQIGAAMGISPATVQREWRLARAWLQRELLG